MTLADWLTLGGGLHLTILVASALVPQVLDWRAELRRLPPLFAQLVWVHGGYIVLTIAGLGVLSLIHAAELAEGSGLARGVCGFIALFWGVRLALQLGYFSPGPYLRTVWLRAGYQTLTVVFAALTVIYGWAAWGPRGDRAKAPSIENRGSKASRTGDTPQGTTLTAAGSASDRQQPFHRVEQLAHLERLAQEAMGPLGAGRLPVPGFVAGGDDDDPRARVAAGGDPVQHAEPAAAGHHYVQHDQIERLTLGADQAGVSIFGGQHLVPAAFQDQPRRFQELSIVVHDQHALHPGLFHDCLPARFAARRRSSTEAYYTVGGGALSIGVPIGIIDRIAPADSAGKGSWRDSVELLRMGRGNCGTGTKWIICVRFTPDGRWLLVAGGESGARDTRRVEIWGVP